MEDMNDEKYMFLGKEMNAEKMLNMCIYNYMKEQGRHEAAKIFAEEAKIEMLELDNDECLLKDWWSVFWPQFCSRMTKQPQGNLQASAQPSMKEALEMLTLLRSPQVHQPPTGNPLQQMNNIVGQPPHMLQTPSGISQRRAGKRPMYTDSTGILGHSGATEMGTGPLGFPPVKLLPTEITQVPYLCNSSHLQMPVPIQPPLHADPWALQLEPNYPAGEGSAYPPTTPHAGEDNWKNQVSAPDGPDSDSFMTRVPAAFLEFMQQ